MAAKRKFKNQYDCVVIGGGPGGLVSALYLGRFRRKVLLVDAGKPRARWIPEIRNLIGYKDGLSGLELLKRLRQQVHHYHVPILKGEATVSREKDIFKVQVGHRSFRTSKVILATGLEDRQPALDNIDELRRHGILGYCPICDGYDHYKDKVALLIRNNRCIRKIQFISRLTPKLHVVPASNFKISKRMQKVFEGTSVHFAQQKLERMTYQPRSKKLYLYFCGKKQPMPVDFAYVAMGVEFNKSSTQDLRGLRRTKDGFLITSAHQETSIPGLYAVGDCVNSLAQVSVAVGQAALAATRIHRDLIFTRAKG